MLLKYRVPSLPYVLKCDCRPRNLALSVPSLQDVQRTMRLMRFHAAQWHVDPHKIGVLEFSAGGFLAAEISTNFDRQLYAPTDAAGKESAKPDFAMLIYPGHLATDDGKFNPNLPITPRYSSHVSGASGRRLYGRRAPVAGLLRCVRQGPRASGNASICTRWTRVRFATDEVADYRLACAG